MTGIAVETWKRLEGEVVDEKFRLERQIGGGEHHGAFLTECGEENPRKAAIKLIPAGLAEPQQLSRWRLAAELSHPHLIRLLQMGRCRVGETEMLYVLTEYAEEDLARVLVERALTPAETREMLGPVLDALAYLHGKGFVHGHIKPANIMAVDEQLKISSDGIWRMAESTRPLGRSGVYDPPEAVGGRVSPTGDVWSLGMTLVEVLTQRVPTWDRKGQGEPVLPPSLPAEFVDVASHCLRRDPQLRWTVADVASRLRRGSPAQAEKAATKYEAPPINWSYVIGAAALILAAVLVGPHVLRKPASKSNTPFAIAEQPTVQPNQSQKNAEKKPALKETSHPAQPTGNVAPPASLGNSEAETHVHPVASAKGAVVRQVLPDVPQEASDTIRGIVRVGVRVQVDAAGGVTDASLDSPGPSKYFAGKALDASRGWKFAPPQVAGQAAPSEWVLHYEFEQTGTTVHPAQVVR